MAVLYREPAGVRRAAASVGGNGVLRLRPAPGRKQRMGMGIVCLRIGNMCEGKADGEEMRVISRLRRVTEFTKLHCLSRPMQLCVPWVYNPYYHVAVLCILQRFFYQRNQFLFQHIHHSQIRHLKLRNDREGECHDVSSGFS